MWAKFKALFTKRNCWIASGALVFAAFLAIYQAPAWLVVPIALLGMTFIVLYFILGMEE